MEKKFFLAFLPFLTAFTPVYKLFPDSCLSSFFALLNVQPPLKQYVSLCKGMIFSSNSEI